MISNGSFQLFGFLGGSVVKNLPVSAGDLGLIPGLGRSPGEGNSYPLQYSGLENSMDCIVQGVAESDMTEPLSLPALGFVCGYVCVCTHPSIEEGEMV